MFHHSEISTQFLEEIIYTGSTLLGITGDYWNILNSAGSYRRYWRLVRITTDYWKLLENTGDYWRLLETTEDKKAERSWCWKWSLPELGNNSIILQYCNNLRWQLSHRMSLILGRKYCHNCNVLQYIAVSVLYSFNKYFPCHEGR